MNRKRFQGFKRQAVVALAGFIFAATVYAYGGGGPPRKSGCTAPQFTDLSPAKEAEVDAFSEFSFMVSENVDDASLVVKVNGKPIEVKKEKKRTGKLHVSGGLSQVISEAGTVLISVAANDPSGKCPGRLAYRVKVSGGGGKESEQP